MKKMLTVKEAVKVTGLSEWELKRGFAAGIYPHIRIGQGRGKFLVDIELLQETLREMSEKSLKSTEPDSGVLPFGIRRVAP